MLGNCSANQSRAAGLQLGEEFRQGRLPQTLGGLYALQQSADCILLPKYLPPREILTFFLAFHSLPKWEITWQARCRGLLRTSRRGWRTSIPELGSR